MDTFAVSEVDETSQKRPYDLEDPEKIRSLLKDLREARQAKSRQGLQLLNHNALSVSSSYICGILDYTYILFSYKTCAQWK